MPRQNRIGGNYFHQAAFPIEKSRATTDNRINEISFSAEIQTFSILTCVYKTAYVFYVHKTYLHYVF